MSPLATLVITYAVGAAFSLLLYFILTPNADLAGEFRKLNWAPIVLGVAIVGLEVGTIYAYKAGWPISTMQIVQAAVLAILLIFVGKIGYQEKISWNKIAGIAVCLGGLALINWK